MSLWDDLTSWIDPTVDWVAEAFNYKDEYLYDAFGDLTTETISAGSQLVDDVKDIV